MTATQAVTDYVAERFSVAGKRAIVTGGSRGIGLAIAVNLARVGAEVTALSSRGVLAAELAEAAAEAGVRCDALAADLSSREETRKLAALLAADDRPIDVFVANAGTILRGPSEEFPEGSWDRVIEVNLNAAWLLAQAVGARMVQRGSGKIIFTASLLSYQGGINVAAYTASKHAIVGVTKALSNEWSAKGVQVNAVAPGYVVTDNTEALREDPARYRAILDRIPTGRWATPDDIAGACLFLASPAADYVSGAVLPVDGGWLGR